MSASRRTLRARNVPDCQKLLPNRERYLLCRIGERIQQRRLHLGISQEELADRTLINRTYLSDIERGLANATFLVLVRIASALDMALAEFFDGVEEVMASIAGAD
jgi:transcriptional regulator with XRE-family HTH domain